MPQMSKGERIARQRLFRYIHEEDLESADLSLALRDHVPLAWHTLELDLDVEEPKTKITLRLDHSVAKFYRAMGHGYQARINRILALWANMQIAKALRQEEAITRLMRDINDKDEARRAAGERPIMDI